MATAPLWTGALLPLATAALLAYVARLVLRRSTILADRLALRMFAVWWACAGLVIVLASAPTLLTLANAVDMRILDVTRTLTAVALALGLCGLLYYLLYIYTGERRLIVLLAIGYAAFFAFEIYYFAQFGERRLETTAWTVRAVADSRPPAWMSALFGVAVAVPILAAAIGYGSLLARVRDPEQRFRVRVVTSAFVLWFAPLLLAFLVGWDDADWFPLLYQAPGVLAGALIVAAFRPPRFLARRWSVAA